MITFKHLESTPPLSYQLQNIVKDGKLTRIAFDPQKASLADCTAALRVIMNATNLDNITDGFTNFAVIPGESGKRHVRISCRYTSPGDSNPRVTEVYTKFNKKTSAFRKSERSYLDDNALSTKTSLTIIGDTWMTLPEFAELLATKAAEINAGTANKITLYCGLPDKPTAVSRV